MAYEPIYSKDTTTGLLTLIPVTDEWILAHKPNQIDMQLSKTTITADGVDSATLTITMLSPVLTDGSQPIIATNEILELSINGETQMIQLTSGVWSEVYTSNVVDTFEFKCPANGFNSVILEAV